MEARFYMFFIQCSHQDFFLEINFAKIELIHLISISDHNILHRAPQFAHGPQIAQPCFKFQGEIAVLLPTP